MFLYPTDGENRLKARTTCPNCNNKYLLDIPEDAERYKTICPKCNNKFIIKKSDECKDQIDECIWEEHGEPRKTILSSLKPKTDKPIIAAIILTLVFIIGLTSTIILNLYSEIFYESIFGLFEYFEINTLINNFNFILSIIIMIFSIFALIGSIASIKRLNLYIILITSFMGIFTIGFFFIGSILSIIAMIIIISSKEEFINEKKEKKF